MNPEDLMPRGACLRPEALSVLLPLKHLKLRVAVGAESFAKSRAEAQGLLGSPCFAHIHCDLPSSVICA